MTIHPDDTYDGGRLCPDVTTWRNGHQRECCCDLCDPTDYDLRLCGNCGTELGRLETGSFCFDCASRREDPMTAIAECCVSGLLLRLQAALHRGDGDAAVTVIAAIAATAGTAYTDHVVDTLLAAALTRHLNPVTRPGGTP